MKKLYLWTILLLSAFLVMPMSASAEPVFAQQTDGISGKVTDETGEPVIGAGVMVKGTTVGTITDIDGFYSINASAGQIIEFSSIGYVTQAVTVGTANVINVVLKTDNSPRHHSL